MKHIFCLLWTFQIQYFCFQLIVAVEKEEIPRLEGLLERGNQNGVKDLRMLGPKEIKEIEPNCEVNRLMQIHHLLLLSFEGCKLYYHVVAENSNEMFH